VHDDPVKRKFTANVPNVLWFNDIIEHATREGILHLCAMMNMWSDCIVGYAINLDLSCDA